MFELSGCIESCTSEFLKGGAMLILSINEKDESFEMYDALCKEEKLSIIIGKYKEKRSRDANAYFWVLCGKLAAKTQQSKTDIYRELIRDIGDNYEILPIRNDAVNKFVSCWGRDSNGRKKLGWICDILGDSKIKGYTNVCAYYGSSTYNSKQMSDLIDGVIFECKKQGIQTMTPDQIAELKASWGGE